MKGYKGFSPGLVCRGKQYAENTVFEEDSAEICKSGMHFCKNPFDVLKHYGFINDKCELNEFAEVESLDEVKTDDGKKFCAKKLKIGAKLSLSGFVKACVDFAIQKTDGVASSTSSGDATQIGSFENYAQVGSSGDSAQIGSSGNYAKICSSGDSARIFSSGDATQIGSSGDSVQIGSSGDCAQIGSSGDSAQIGSFGDSAQIGSSGNYAKICSSGGSARICSSGYAARICSSGDSARICSSGDGARIYCNGSGSVVCCSGHASTVRAPQGCWVTLAEWGDDDNEDRRVPICVKTEFVDGVRIKADTWYRLNNGEFVEVLQVEMGKTTDGWRQRPVPASRI